MKKTISIIALLMLAGMSAPSLADNNEGVKIKFSGGQDNKAAKQQSGPAAQKTRDGGKSDEQSGNEKSDSNPPKRHDH